MSLLAIETSTQACSAALRREDGRIFHQYTEDQKPNTELILPLVEQVLLDAECKRSALTKVAVSVGPGRFNGLRVGLSVAQGIALGVGCLLIPVCSLSALAQVAQLEYGLEDVWVCIDARMGGVYWGRAMCSDLGLMKLVDGPSLSTLEMFSSMAQGAPVMACGQFEKNQWLLAYPTARAIAQLAQATSASEAQPPETVQAVYIRNQVTG